MPQPSIREICTQRGIADVVHFTSLANVASILRHGLLPRSQHAQLGLVDVELGDSIRLDGLLEATSLSVSFPNYKMFWSLRNEHPQRRWAVLVLEPRVLWEIPCAFYEVNAASAAMRSVPASARSTTAWFERMFADETGVRMQAGISDELTTNPQAEVMAFGRVAPDAIREIHIPRGTQAPRDLPSAQKLRVSDRFFLPRHDHAWWKKEPDVVEYDPNDPYATDFGEDEY